MKKKKMIFDGTLLANGINKNCGRSGIYFTAYNIFKKFAESDKFDIVLYCQINRRDDLKKFLDRYFENYDFTIISDSTTTNKETIYKQLKKIKYTAKINKEIFLKIIIQMTMLITSISIHVDSFFRKIFNSKDTLDYYGDYDIIFSPGLKIQDVFKRTTIKRYVLLHDVIPLIFTEKLNPDNWWTKLFNSLNSDDYYFTNSEYTKKIF